MATMWLFSKTIYYLELKTPGIWGEIAQTGRLTLDSSRIQSVVDSRLLQNTDCVRLKHMILLPQSPKCWDYMHVRPVKNSFFIIRFPDLHF